MSSSSAAADANMNVGSSRTASVTGFPVNTSTSSTANIDVKMSRSSRKRQRSPVGQHRSLSAASSAAGVAFAKREGQLSQPCITVFSRSPYIISGANQVRQIDLFIITLLLFYFLLISHLTLNSLTPTFTTTFTLAYALRHGLI
jgi:hypothetical protein